MNVRVQIGGRQRINAFELDVRVETGMPFLYLSGIPDIPENAYGWEVEGVGVPTGTVIIDRITSHHDDQLVMSNPVTLVTSPAQLLLSLLHRKAPK